MKQMTFVLMLALTTLAPVLLGVPRVEALNCGDTLGPGGSFTLTTDVGPCTTPAGLFVAGPVTVDLNGHTVSCNTRGGGDIGIDIQGSGAVVKNGGVTVCNTGVRIEGHTSQVTSVVAIHNNGQGFLVIGAGHNTLANNAAVFNGFSGFSVDAGANLNTFTGNKAAENGVYGFEIASSSNSFSRGNTASDNTSDGFHVTGSLNKFTGNTAAHHSQRGFAVAGDSNSFTGNTAVTNSVGFSIFLSSHNTLHGNTATANDTGFFLDASTSSNTLSTNEAFGNGNTGIYVNSTHNSISRNVAVGNFFDDLQDANPSCDNNIWSGNVFGSHNQACAH